MNRRFLTFIVALAVVFATMELPISANGLSSGYTLTIIAGEGGTATGGGDYAEGEIVNISAEPDNGYIFVYWYLEDGFFENQEYAETTFTMPDNNVTITAIFQSEDFFAELDAEFENIKLINNGVMPDIYTTEENCIPRFINGKYSDVIVTDEKSAIESLCDIKSIMFFEDPYEEFELIQVTETENTIHYRLQQLYNGLTVYGKQLIVTTDLSGNIRSLNGNYTVIYGISAIPNIDNQTAYQIAETAYGEIVADGELIIYTLSDNSPELAWYFETQDCLVYVSVEDGENLKAISLSIEATVYAYDYKTVDILMFIPYNGYR